MQLIPSHLCRTLSPQLRLFEGFLLLCQRFSPMCFLCSHPPPTTPRMCPLICSKHHVLVSASHLPSLLNPLLFVPCCCHSPETPLAKVPRVFTLTSQSSSSHCSTPQVFPNIVQGISIHLVAEAKYLHSSYPTPDCAQFLLCPPSLVGCSLLILSCHLSLLTCITLVAS